MMNHVKSLRSFVLIGTLTLISTGGAGADDGRSPGRLFPSFNPFTIKVDCAAGDTIARAVGAAWPGLETRIVLLSNCTEDVTIRKDGITVNGDPNGTDQQGGSTTLFGSIQFEDAHRVGIRNLTISNPSGDGVVATAGANFNVEDAVIANNSGGGVVVEDAASGTIRNSVISDNVGEGVLVVDGAFLRIEHNLIENNGLDEELSGVAVARAVVRANGNQYFGNGYAAIEVAQNGTYRTGVGDVAEIIRPGPLGYALDISRESYVGLRFVDMTGEIEMSPASELDIRGTSAKQSRVSVDIRALNLSVARIVRNVDAEGSTLFCDGQSICFCNTSRNANCPEDISHPVP